MFKRHFKLALLIILTGTVQQSSAQQRLLIDSIAGFSKPVSGTVGVAYKNLKTGEMVVINGNKHFPMQSVMKFPLALAVLHQVDEGKMRLADKIFLSSGDLSIPFVSPIRDKYPGGNVELTVDELLRFTVSLSDNNGCDKLFQLLGGPKAVNDYIHGLGVRDISIVATEKEMGQGWEVQYRNWCTPKAMLKLLELFEKGGILLKASRAYLYQLMIETVNAPGRMKGLLPAGTRVAHKPGTSSVNSKGIAAATNDVGIVEVSGSGRFALAAFVSDASAELKVREEAIAKITRLFWHHDASR